MARGLALAAVGARRFSDTLASKLAALAASLANAARLGAQGRALLETAVSQDFSDFRQTAQKQLFARAVGAVGVRALARNIKSNSKYKGFAAEAIPVNLLPAPARTHGNRARQLAPRAGTAARPRAKHEIHRECEGSARDASFRAERVSGERKCAKTAASTLRAHLV